MGSNFAMTSAQGTSVCQVTVIGAIVILLYASRACYNLVVLALSNKSINSFDYDWYNVSDQVSAFMIPNYDTFSQIRVWFFRPFDQVLLTSWRCGERYSKWYQIDGWNHHSTVRIPWHSLHRVAMESSMMCGVFQADLQSTLGGAGYIVFGVVLFVWELLPTSLVVFFFRVQRPAQDRVSQLLPYFHFPFLFHIMSLDSWHLMPHLSCRAAQGFRLSPLGLISLTTHAVMTATMTWLGPSCLKTSKPGNNNSTSRCSHQNTALEIWQTVERSKFMLQQQDWMDAFVLFYSPVWLQMVMSGGAKAAASVPISEGMTHTTSPFLQRSWTIIDWSS